MKQTIIKTLIHKGVNIPNPDSVYISNDVNPDRISNKNVTIYSGCKILGKRTLISKNSSLGFEAPVTIEDSLLGENIDLNGGYFNGAVFLGHNSFASGAHVRQGTIIEEGAKAAHTVGLKQTILFPFVTLGSLINFCDCFMSGGTDRKNHSEVGSSFIHFNYTPNQDKATPSMIGDIHNGVMLNSNPIFLGGQGGLVGPAKIGYGCISAAGSIIRKSELNEDRLLLGGGYKEMSLPRQFYVYKNIVPIFNLNIEYISGLVALKSWYSHIRTLFITDSYSAALIAGLKENLLVCIEERIKRLIQFSEKLEKSKQILIEKSISKTKNSFLNSIMNHEKTIAQLSLAIKVFASEIKNNEINLEGEAFKKKIESYIKKLGKEYIQVIKNLSENDRQKGSEWLYNIEKGLINQLKLK